MSDEEPVIGPPPAPLPMTELLPTDDPEVWATSFCQRHNGAVVLLRGAFNERGADTVVEESTMLKWFTDFRDAQVEMGVRRAHVESQAAMGRVVKAPPLPMPQSTMIVLEDNDE